MAASTQQYQNELVRIRRQYLDSLPEKINDLEDALSGLSDSERPERELKALNRIAHQLAASAGSYGFTEVSNAARELDMAFDETDEKPLASMDDTVAQAVQEMGDALVDLLRQVPS